MQSAVIQITRVYEFNSAWFPWSNDYFLIKDSDMHSLWYWQSLIGKIDLYVPPQSQPYTHTERELLFNYVDGFFQARCNADALTFGEILKFHRDPVLDMEKINFSLVLTISGRNDDYTFPTNVKDSSTVTFSDKKVEKVYKSSFQQNGNTFRLVLEFRHLYEKHDPGVPEDDFIVITNILFDNHNNHFSPNGVWTWSYNVSWSDNFNFAPETESSSLSDSFEHISLELEDD